MGFGTAKPASEDGSGRHCNDPVPNSLMLGGPNSRVLLFSSEFIHPTQRVGWADEGNPTQS